MFKFLLRCSVTVMLMSACGSPRTETVREYRIFVDSDDEAVLTTTRALVEQFNADAGDLFLSITESPEGANSSIEFDETLLAERNILAYGSSKVQEKETNLLPRRKLEFHYSMRLLFDLGNFTQRTGSEDDRESGAWRHLYHLFCHEVGHGLTMTHEDSRDSVMFYSIPKNSRTGVDYESYFEGVRAFFSN